MSDALRFGRHELLPALRELRCDGAAVPLGARAFDLLVALADRRDRVVTKAELLARVWPGLIVEENNLQVQVSALRKALGPGAIATLPGRGYRLTVDCASHGPPVSPGACTPAAPEIIGRDGELDGLRACMANHRLVTIVGAGGIGKTAVARALARSSHAPAEGALAWVDLAALPTGANAATVAAAVAAAVGAPLAEGDAPLLLARVLGGRPLLLVLDNAEHVAQAVAAVAVALLEGTAALRLLVTSQLALHVVGEQVWRLDVLSLPPPGASLDDARAHGAFALFERRARQSDHRFMLGAADVQRAIALCHALDGNALAIELAAARAPQLGMGPLLERLNDRLRLLRHAGDAPPLRQRSLAAALGWSWSLLDNAAQTVLRRLSVFAGPFILEAAQQVCADDSGLDEWAVLDALVALVDRSLVHCLPGEPPRYRLLESTRLHARAQLASAGETEPTFGVHGRVMASVGEAIRTTQWRLTVGELADRHAPALADLELAFDRACERRDAPVAAAVGMGLVAVVTALSLPGRRRACMTAAQTLQDCATDPQTAARLATMASPWSSVALATPPRLEAARRRLAAWQQVGDAVEVYLAECQVAAEQSRAGDLPAAAATYAAALSAEVRDWPARLRYQGAGAASDIAQYSGEPGAGRRAAERMLALALEAGDQWITLLSRFHLADHAAGDGDLQAAIALGLECVAALEALRRPEKLGMTLANLCSAYLQAGDNEAARAAAARALPLLRSHLYAGVLFNHIALIAVRDGDLSAAARLLGHSDAWYALYQTTRRQSTEARSEEPARAAIIAGLGASEAQALLHAGGALGDAGADALARQFLGRVGGAVGAV